MKKLELVTRVFNQARRAISHETASNLTDPNRFNGQLSQEGVAKAQITFLEVALRSPQMEEEELKRIIYGVVHPMIGGSIAEALLTDPRPPSVLSGQILDAAIPRRR